MSKCCRWAWLVRAGDSKDEARIKTVMFPFALFIFLYSVFDLIQTIQGSGMMMYVLGDGLNCLGSGFFMAGVASGAARAGGLLDVFLVLCTVGICLLDFGNFTRSNPFRSWAFIVLVLDCALVFKRDHLPGLIILFVLLYNTVIGLESSVGLGLDEAGYWGSEGVEVSQCNCASPPCESGVASAISVWVNVCVIFLGDFYLTMGFATGMRFQLRRVEASVELTGEVAAALARYDVDAAESALDSDTVLPQELVGSYRRLLNNLRSYRNYLPDTLLYDDGLSSPRALGVAVAPVGLGGGTVDAGMVFTDIQSSTALWEEFPQEMYEALRIHNSTLRRVALKHLGYEVKVIGDAMMLAFGSALDAVRFGVEAQEALVESHWPAALCEHPLCRSIEGPTGEPMWNGVRVRIGINWGPAEAERNPVTGRFDFFGSTVNTASR
eukprot:Hpha_TRINITY_DN15119_c6_g2::TRINITY_DN15119_c6_g2_i1::g.126772::m.126772